MFSDFLEVNQVNGDHSVSSRGTVHITADNGYILFINGDRIAAGGAALPATDPMWEADGWVRTDAYTFRDTCQTPTTFAVEAVDAGGVAALLVEIDHCKLQASRGSHSDRSTAPWVRSEKITVIVSVGGNSITSGSDWKCAVGGCTPGATTGTTGCSEINSRTFTVIPTAMNWNDARAACQAQFPGGNLASIHSAAQQAAAETACQEA